MLAALKFVKGAVAKKSFIPEMQHVAIEGGFVRAFNGTLALCSPIDFDVDCAPSALQLIQALSSCKDVVSLAVVGSGKLRVQSGKFKAFVNCFDLDDLPHQQPEGEVVDVDGEHLLNAFKMLAPFVGDDASRPWMNGVLLRGQSAFATNGICLVEYWLGVHLPVTVNIPLSAMNEVVRIGEDPVSIQVSDHSITFHYTDGRWVRSQLFETNWPDFTRILANAGNPVPVPESFFKGLGHIKGFVDGTTVHIIDGSIRSHIDENIGASFEVEGLVGHGAYDLTLLAKLEGVAASADFTAHPNPCTFFGERLRGALMGKSR